MIASAVRVGPDEVSVIPSAAVVIPSAVEGSALPGPKMRRVKTCNGNSNGNCNCISRGGAEARRRSSCGRLRSPGRDPLEAALRFWGCGGEISPRILKQLQLPLQFSAAPRPPREMQLLFSTAARIVVRQPLRFSVPSAPPRETLSWKLPGTDEFTARGRCRSLDSLRSLGMTYTLRSLGMTYTLRSLGMTDSRRLLGMTVSA